MRTNTFYSDEQLMEAAFTQAQKAVGKCGNNPPVGCVISFQQHIIAKGHTQPNGTHAEIHAMQQVDFSSLHQTDIAVTLEPCCFHGRTPPCTQALIKAKPKRIIVAHRDPHPKVRGQGITLLRQANIIVIEGVMASQAALFLKSWLSQFPPLPPS